MPFTYADYMDCVLEYYERLGAEKSLPLNLSDPTPARLKKACLLRYKQERDRKDEKILNDFFEPERPKWTIEETMEQFSIDRFRPLVNYLKGQTGNPDEKNIYLLAWLIDFQPRPYEVGMKDPREEEKREGPDVPEEEDEEGEPVSVIENPTPPDAPVSPGPNQDGGGKRGGSGTDSIGGEKEKKPRRWVVWIAATAAACLGAALMIPGGGGSNGGGRGSRSDSQVVAPASQPIINPVVGKAGTVRLKTQTNRCLSLTRAGTQCSRTAKEGRYCWQHKNNPRIIPTPQGQ